MINTKIKLSINIADTLLDDLTEIGKEHYPNEFGGFLIGNYSYDFKQLNITDTILPTKFKASKYQFERDATGIIEIWKNYYEQIPKKYYVGEWHTHPNNLPIPSSTDIIAISSIAKNKEASIKNPVLLIIGYNKIDCEFGFYVWFKNKLHRYE